MIKNKLVVPGIAALGIVAGIASAGVAANAEGTSSTSSNSSQTSGNTAGSSSSQGAQRLQGPPTGPHRANGKTETELTGDQLTKATEAAKAKVPGATVNRAETDVDGEGAYEVHMTKSDGSKITVFLDANFSVTSTQDGVGKGSPDGVMPPRLNDSTDAPADSTQ